MTRQAMQYDAYTTIADENDGAVQDAATRKLRALEAREPSDLIDMLMTKRDIEIRMTGMVWEQLHNIKLSMHAFIHFILDVFPRFNFIFLIHENIISSATNLHY